MESHSQRSAGKKAGCQFRTLITLFRHYKSIGVVSLLGSCFALSCQSFVIPATNIIYTVVCSGTSQQSHLVGKLRCQLDYPCSGIIQAVLQSIP